MQENSRYAVGIDVGTTTVRCVVGHIDATSGTPTVVGVGKASNSGMRKGVVVHLNGPAQAIDDALGEAERMSGYEIHGASLSVNGTHILSTKADGMIAVGPVGHEVDNEDVRRLEDVATVGKVPANRDILQVVPHSYRLDGQDNIKNPIGMTGTRLELVANVISALTPHIANLTKASEMASVTVRSVTPSVLAAGRAVLTEQQMENGVAVIDIGGATTSLAIFEEGDLQFVSVIPLGGVNITNDLAIGLKTDPAIAEQVKLEHGSALARSDDAGVNVKQDEAVHTFQTTEIDEIIEARLDEIFETIQKELKRAGKSGQLPNGVVLVGGTSNLEGIAEYAKRQLSLAVRVGVAVGHGGVTEEVEVPEFAAAVGLMLVDSDSGDTGFKVSSGKVSQASTSIKKPMKAVSNFLGRFKP